MSVRGTYSLFFLFVSTLFFQIPLEEAGFEKKQNVLLSKIDSAETTREKTKLYVSLVKLLIDEKPNEAVKYLKKLEELTANDTLSKERVEYLNYQALHLMNTGVYDSASYYYIKALDLAEKIEAKENIEAILNNLAILNIKSHSFENGIKYFERLVQLAEEEHAPEKKAPYLLNLSLAYAQNGELKKAEKNLKALFSSTKNNFYKAVAANSLSYIFNISERFKEAEKYGKFAVKYAKKEKDLQLELEAMTNYSNALRSLKKLDEAEKIISRILRLSKENNLLEQYVNALGNIALLYEDKGDYKLALEYQKKFSAMSDSLLNENVTKQINELQVKYETEKKDREIALRDAAIERKNIAIRYSAFVAVISTIFLIVVFILYTKKRKAYLEITRMHLSEIQEEKSKERVNKKGDEGVSEESKLREEKVEALFAELEKKIKEEKLFTQKDLTLGKLAAEFNVSAKYLSQVIHQKYGTTFPDFINKLRVKEVAKLLIDPAYDNFSLEGIAELAGFKSRSVFNSAFKKFMGVTPSFYQNSAKKILREEEKASEEDV